MEDSEVYIGLMSGTSVDSVDAVALNFTKDKTLCLGSVSLEIETELRNDIGALCYPGFNEIERSQKAANQISILYAQTVSVLLKKLQLSASDIRALGAHGQTVRHRPDAGATTQLINGALLAELTRIDTITDFRNRDIATGGQGAPLVPLFHRQWFQADKSRAVLNIGGISNLTVLPAKNSCDDILGFDCGPGNTLMDSWIELHFGKRFDQNSEWASQGKVLPYLLQKLLEEPYFSKAIPKSTGRELFNLSWLKKQIKGTEKPEDIQRTLLELTAQVIATSLKHWAPDVCELFICGGGAENPLLVERIARLVHPVSVNKTDTLGLATKDIEGAAFAWLARCYVHRIFGNAPSVTGASGERILGCLYPA